MSCPNPATVNWNKFGRSVRPYTSSTTFISCQLFDMSGDGKTEAMDLDPKGAAADQTLAKDGFEQLTQEYYEGKHISEPVKEIKVYPK